MACNEGEKLISLILLASGFSRRFGTNKLLYEIDGIPMYRYALERLQGISQKEILGHNIRLTVVTQYQEIGEFCNLKGIYWLLNTKADEGISASIRLGVGEDNSSEYYFFFVADQPYLRETTIEDFIIKVISRDARLASVCSSNVPGNPTAFYKSYREELLGLSGDTGGRKILNNNPDEIMWYEVPKEEIRDIDEAISL